MPKVPGAGRKEGTSKAAIEHRVGIVTELVIRGFTLSKFKELYKQNQEAKASGSTSFKPDLDWNVRGRMLDEYYRRTQENVSRLSNLTIEGELALVKARYEELFQRAVTKGALGVAARVLKDKADLLRLGQFVQVTEVPSSSTPEEGSKTDVTQVRLPDGTLMDL